MAYEPVIEARVEAISYVLRSQEVIVPLPGSPVRMVMQAGFDAHIHTFAIALALLFYRFPRACFRLGVRNPFATQAFVDLLSDQATYPEVIL